MILSKHYSMETSHKIAFDALQRVCSILNISAEDILSYLANQATGDKVITHGLRYYDITPSGVPDSSQETWYRVSKMSQETENELRNYFDLRVVRDAGRTYVNSRSLASLMWFADIALKYTNASIL